MSVKTLLKLNKLFRVPEHPFNAKNNGRDSAQNREAAGGSADCSLAYAQWQYERAKDALACYAPNYTPGDILFRKKVLDIGCGAGGKSVYYAEKWSADVTGMDILEQYAEPSEAFARKHGVDPDDILSRAPNAGSFRFVCADAANMGISDAADTSLADKSFDTIIMNDAFEHLADPEAVLCECGRLLKPGGRVFINFPPYGHPYGAHLSDLIGIPWVHRLFSEQDCTEAYRQLAEDLDERTRQNGSAGSAHNFERPAVSGAERIRFRFSEGENGALKNSYINKMTLKRFKDILKTTRFDGQKAASPSSPESAGLRLSMYKEIPLRGWLTPLAKIPGLKENFVRMVVCVFEKEGGPKRTGGFTGESILISEK